ncbi:MAG: hypothetical protein M3Q30_02725 [Actinomycetota bacterium]|nr:hypothetical protein [Actinomycetota bacterium]
MLQTRHLMQALEAAGADRNVVYVSVPITSGRREIALFEELDVRNADELRNAYRERWLTDVVRANEDEAHLYASEVRRSKWAAGSIVVDPSRMKVEGWAQDDYNAFWVELMERHVCRVVATPGWSYSRGARIELGLALSLALEVVDLDGRPLSPTIVTEEAEAARAALLCDGWSQEEVDAYLPPLSVGNSIDLQPSAQSDAFSWLVAERARQVVFFGPDTDDDRTRTGGLSEGGGWKLQLNKYWDRAEKLGPDTLNGRLALAKFVATACGMLESALRTFGPIPDVDDGN